MVAEISRLITEGANTSSVFVLNTMLSVHIAYKQRLISNGMFESNLHFQKKEQSAMFSAVLI